MAAYKYPITLEAALKEVTEERFCKGHHYRDVALTDEMVEQIVQVKSLVNMGFINTDITDEAIKHLATLPKLKLLFLEDNKQVTGEGFKYFADKPIDHISLDGCPVTDETLKTVLQVPRLKSLSLKRTPVTFEGLMAVAHYNKVSFYLDKPFTAEQIKAFEQAQRTAGKKKPAAPPTDDLPIVKQLLLDFFAAMTQWEAFAAKNDDTQEDELLVQEKCKALFQKYCTDKRRAGYRPEGISYSLDKGGTYRAHQIIDSELVTKNKIYLYTQDDRDFQFRFLIIRKNGAWKIDDCQRHDGGWKKIRIVIMKTGKQLIEDELQKTIHQLKEVSLLREEKQALVSYKKELEQLLFLKKLSDTYHLEPKEIERIIVLPPPGTDFANFRLVDDAETEEKQWWEELKIENEPLWLCEGDILIKKR